MTITASTSIDVPLSTITVDGASVRFAASLPRPASFDGRISEDGNSLSGKASNADGEAPFQLTRNGEPKVAVPPPSSALSKEFEGAWEGTGNVDVDFGLDTPFLYENLQLTPADEDRVRANVARLLDFTNKVEKNAGTSGRLLWSDSDQDNLAQKLIARLQKVQ